MANPHGEGTTPDDDGRIGGDRATGYSKPSALQPPILLLTVNPRETDALRAVFCHAQAPEDFPRGDYPYQRFAPVIDAAGRPEREVIAFCCQMGSERSGAALQRVTKAIGHFEPAAVLAVGVGFGLRDRQRLGDVMISTQVTTYEPARLNRDGSIQRRAETPAATTPWLERAVRIDLPGIQRRNGLLLCGEKLVDNPEFRESLRRDYPLAVGGDMESFGVVTACNGHDRLKIGWLIIKGVSDLGDGDKNAGGPMQADLDQYQAAYRAAMVAYSTVHLRRPDAPSPREAAQAWLKAQADAGSDDWLSLDPSGETSRPSSHSRTHSTPVPAESPIPRGLQPPGYAFRGRSELLAALVERLQQGRSTAVVGDAGMGKTALVVEALQQVLGRDPGEQQAALRRSRFADGIVFLDLYLHHGQAEPVWGALATARGEPAKDSAGNEVPALQRAIAACGGKRLLLVVEGGEEARGTTEADGFVRTTRTALLDPLPLQQTTVLWLSRRGDQWPSHETLSLEEPLGDDDARALFDELAADPATGAPRVAPPLRDRALALLHGHPLAITWTAALMASGNVVKTDLLADLAEQPSLSLHDPQQKAHTLAWLFGRSLRGLDPDARCSLLAAGLLAADALPRAAIAAATGLDDRAQRIALEACLAARLLRLDEEAYAETGVPGYRFGHALAYEYARERARAEPDVAALLKGLAEWADGVLKAGLAVNAPTEATVAVPHTLAHALALLAADTPPWLWRPLVANLLYEIADRLEALGQLVSARLGLEVVAWWLEQARGARPEFSRWLRETISVHSRQGHLSLLHGDLIAAQSHFEASFTLSEQLVAQEAENSDSQHVLSISHEKLGDIRHIQGDLSSAQRHYESALLIRKRLVEKSPEKTHWQHSLWASFNKLGEIQQSEGYLASAQQHYASGLEIAQRLVSQYPENAELKRDLGITHSLLGDVKQAQGNLIEAQRHCVNALTIAERLAEQDPTNARWQRDLSVNHHKLGEVKQAQGDLHHAQRHYTVARTISERLARQDPVNAGWQHDLAITLIKLAEVRGADGDVPGTLEHLQAARAILQALCQQVPEHPQFQRDMSNLMQWIAALEGGSEAP